MDIKIEYTVRIRLYESDLKTLAISHLRAIGEIRDGDGIDDTQFLNDGGEEACFDYLEITLDRNYLSAGSAQESAIAV